MKVGQILEAKSGKFYLKVEKDFNAVAGDALFLSTPQEDIAFLLENGKITKEEADLKVSKIPSFVKYNVKVNSKNADSTQTL